jgi:hypothetical protein
MNPIPSVLAILICDKIIEEAQTGKKTLVGLFGRLNAAQLPVALPFAIYVKLTDGEGDYAFRINISLLDETSEQLVAQVSTPPQNIPSRLTVAELALNLPPIPFSKFGRHEVQLYANEVYIAHTTLDVVQAGEL